MSEYVERCLPGVESLRAALDSLGYLADDGLATALFLALRLPQPLLLEGEAGVGKTEAAKAVAAILGSPLIRLQCYDGLDAAEALYEWNYPRQLLGIRLAEAAVTIPEIGTIRAAVPPVVLLTSNRTRDLHDALKRRCLYHWIDYPDTERIVEIVRRRVPGTSRELAIAVSAAVRRLRALDVQKTPGVAETIDWISALNLLGVPRLDAEIAGRTLGSLLKYREDQELVRERGLDWLVAGRQP
ncbi:AAA family ATPase [Streptomyces phaeochromogenes]|uniref:AAA family ATPase n=1 Tax=Streptomyces phaeochromogenes TaxID=1923 RepID=UPI0036927C79